jgi:hypothetical protein
LGPLNTERYFGLGNSETKSRRDEKNKDSLQVGRRDKKEKLVTEMYREIGRERMDGKENPGEECKSVKRKEESGKG